jgi:hypothetical protein
MGRVIVRFINVVKVIETTKMYRLLCCGRGISREGSGCASRGGDKKLKKRIAFDT